ncbi:hypothetical protein [Mangrovicoccus ximenensis]|uniref:hypothetical protein n=1 Tax=Mangrovicoccus ximenensis TaxID=1911570 RepID=UPI000D3C79B5|nr:hypothetical protein [Mangrovicoccus ximenensis]
MVIDPNEIEAQLALIDWRNRETDAVTARLEAAFPALLAELDRQVDALPAYRLADAHLRLKRTLQEAISDWATEQQVASAEHAETSLGALLDSIPAGASRGEAMKAGAALLAPPAMLAASALALPAILTFATVTSTTWLVVTTSSVSLPLLAVGGAVLAGANVAGVKVLSGANRKLRERLRKRLHPEAHRMVFGDPARPETTSVLDNLQTVILACAAQKLGNMP